jgi:hypothetical protein
LQAPFRGEKGEDAMATEETAVFEKAAVLESPFEAQVLASILEDEGVPHLVRSYHDTAYDGLFQMQKGWGEIRARPVDAYRVREILDLVRSDKHDISIEYETDE